MLPSRLPRLSVLVVVAAVLALVAPIAARGAVTASGVTSPAPATPTITSIDVSPGAPAVPLPVSGTATVSDPGDQVDLVCARWAAGTVGPQLTTLVPAVDTDDATGAWSTTIPNLASLPAEAPCLLMAVPAGPPPADLGPFAGSWLYLSRREVTKFAAGPQAGKVRDFAVTVVQPGGVATYGPVSECGICTALLASGANQELGDELLRGAATLAVPAALAGDRGAIVVDGTRVQDPAAAGATPGADAFPGYEPLDVQVTTAANGDTTIVETFSLLRADGPARFVALGLRWKRTTLHTQGRTASVTDELASTDGKQHEVDLWTQEATGSAAPGAGIMLPWVAGSTFRAYAAGEELTRPTAAPNVLYVRTKRDADATSTRYPVGAVVRSYVPDALRMGGSPDGDVHHANVKATVPAGGVLVLRHGYAWGESVGAVDAQVAKLNDQFAGPQLTVTSPKVGATVLTRPVTVTGRATDNGTVTAVSVNGLKVKPTADGRWSVRLALTDGKRRITVLATDSGGNTTRVSFRVNVTAIRITGTNRKEKITGTERGNTILALGGNDTVLAKGGVDAVNGGPGNDRIDLGSGSDRGRGLAGADVIDCGNGARRDVDRLEGGAGNDRLRCPDGRGNDLIVGGPGFDRCLGDRGDRFRSCEVRRTA